MIAKLERDSGHPIAWWLEQVRASAAERFGERVAHLKSTYGLGHGYANLIVHLASRPDAGEAPADLVEVQYRGKEALRPVCDRIVDVVRGFGPDVEVAPKKASVSLRRRRQFALVEPATRTRIDLGLNLGDTVPAGRLEAARGMCSHVVRLTTAADVDDAVIAWLRDAYDRA